MPTLSNFCALIRDWRKYALIIGGINEYPKFTDKNVIFWKLRCLILSPRTLTYLPPNTHFLKDCSRWDFCANDWSTETIAVRRPTQNLWKNFKTSRVLWKSICPYALQYSRKWTAKWIRLVWSNWIRSTHLAKPHLCPWILENSQNNSIIKWLVLCKCFKRWDAPIKSEYTFDLNHLIARSTCSDLKNSNKCEIFFTPFYYISIHCMLFQLYILCRCYYRPR